MRDLSEYWDSWPYPSAEEQRAADVLRTCCSKRRMRTMPVPIPVEELIEGPLRLRFEVSDLSPLGRDVIGSASCEKPLTISVSETIENQDGRFRFTSAHELGHIIMHRFRQNRFNDGDETMFAQNAGLEAEANRFASGFLMPWPALEFELQQIFNDYGMDPKHYLPMLFGTNSRAVWLWKHRILPRVTGRFRVSLSAAIYRFTSLRLADGTGFLPRVIVPELLTGEFSFRQPLREALLLASK